MHETKNLIWGLFGDMPAVDFITTFAQGLTTSKKKVTVTAGPQREDGCLVWNCELAVGEKDDERVVYPFALALIRSGLGAQRVTREMGFDASSCLRIVGAGSKHRRPDGLVSFFSGTSNEAHLRDFNHYPCTGSARMVANQALESFVINRYLRAPKAPSSQPGQWRLRRRRHLGVVDETVVAATSS